MACRARPAPVPPAPVPPAPFTMRVVVEGLASPWALELAPDGWLWVTERGARRIARVHPETGQRHTVATIAEAQTSSNQTGVLGLAFDPAWPSAPFVYLAYVYDTNPGPELERHVKIARYTWDGASLGDPRELIAGLPGSNDHNAGRLRFGADGFLYFTIGDQGKNQYARKCEPNRAQVLPTGDELARSEWSAYEGKVLRLARDGSIPPDNPVLEGVRSHVFSYGHRNPQGLAFGRAGRIYVSEHGPKTDDEINLIIAGKNYGWPHVAGFLDDRAYAFGDWSAAPDCAALRYDPYQLPASVPRARESAWSHPDFMPPLRTLYSVDDDFAFARGDCMQREPACWPTIAPSALAFYPGRTHGLAAWGDALLVPSLKDGSVYLIRLDDRGRPREEDAPSLFASKNRYRDLAVSPDGYTFYVLTDSEGFTSGPTQHSTKVLTHRGAILAFQVRR